MRLIANKLYLHRIGGCCVEFITECDFDSLVDRFRNQLCLGYLKQRIIVVEKSFI